MQTYNQDISDHIYTEIRQNFQKVTSQGLLDKANEAIITAIKNVVDFSFIARREGLLALEEAAGKLSGEGNEKYFGHMVMLIVDGAEPSIIEEVCMLRYYSTFIRDDQSLNALVYLTYFLGARSIQLGENARVTEEKLLMLVSDGEARKYRQERIDEHFDYGRGLSDTDVKALYEGEITIQPQQDGYFAVKLADYIFKNLNDRCIQRLLRDTENKDLAYCMKGISGAARKKIFDNLSERLGMLIAEDITYIRTCPASRTARAAEQILRTYFKLQSAGEVIPENNDEDILENMYRLFLVRPEDLEKSWTQTKKHELEELFEAFKNTVGA